MERNFTDENFEHFLKQNADGLRMRPTDKVWKGISNRINNRRRKTRIIFGISLLIATALGYYVNEQSGTFTTHTAVHNNSHSIAPPVSSQNAASLHVTTGQETAQTGKSSLITKSRIITQKQNISTEPS